MHTNARTAVSSLSAAALAGGLAVGVGLMSPASAMRLDPQESPTPSIGAQCHAARAALARNGTISSTTTHRWRAPSLVDGKPGLRCGQVFTSKKVEESTSTEGTTDQSGTVQQTAPLVPEAPATEHSPATTDSSEMDQNDHSENAYEGDQHESELQDQSGQTDSTEHVTDSAHTWGGSSHHGDNHGD